MSAPVPHSQPKGDLVRRIRARPNDAPMPTERLLDDAADRIEELESALRKHARHTSSCRYHGGHDCDCGLDEIRAALPQSSGAARAPTEPK